MQYDFSTVEERDSFVTVPEGVYVCKVEEVRPGLAKDGSARWSLRLNVDEGELGGRTAGWDSITWSERGIFRVKHVLEALGFDVAGTVEIEPADLVGRRAKVQFELEQWEDPLSGKTQVRLRVPYLGFAPCDPLDGRASVVGQDSPVAIGGAVGEALGTPEEKGPF